MKAKKIVMSIVLVAVLSLSIGYEQGWAQGKEEISPARIGVVNIGEILRTSEKHAQWQNRMDVEKQKNIARFQDLLKEIKEIKEDLKTRKVGSKDHLDFARLGMEKEALLDVSENFYDQEISLKVQQWTEQLYKEIIASSEKVAKEKGLDMVLAKQDFETPTVNIRELFTFLRLNNLLYHAKELDITNEVLADMDAEDKEK